jgi:hypothetical protein
VRFVGLQDFRLAISDEHTQEIVIEFAVHLKVPSFVTTL